MAVSADSTMALPVQALMNNTMNYDGVKHPYYPLDANIAGYVANESTVLSLLGSFVAGCVAIFGSTYLAVKRVNPRLPTNELLTIMWFVLCGCIHLFFEGKEVLLSELHEEMKLNFRQAILHTIMQTWADCRRSSDSFGKNMRSRIRDILQETSLYSVLKP